MTEKFWQSQQLVTLFDLLRENRYKDKCFTEELDTAIYGSMDEQTLIDTNGVHDPGLHAAVGSKKGRNEASPSRTV